MGRHSAPPTGEPAAALSNRVIGLAVAAVAVVIAVGVLAFGTGDGSTTTSGPPAGSTDTAAAPTISSKAPSASPTKKSTRPKPNKSTNGGAKAGAHTLVIRVTGRSYVSVVTGDGRTLVARIFTKGQRKSFDNKLLRVTLGNAAVVRVRINGAVVKPERTGRVAAFTAHRK